MSFNLKKNISDYLCCSKCQQEFESGMTDSESLQGYSRLDVGFTNVGLQVWCRRHEINVCHIDFEGNELETDFRCLLEYSDN